MAPTPTPIPEPSSSALHMTQINALNKQIQELLAKNAELRRDLDTERLRGEQAVSEIAKRSKEEVSGVKAVAETVGLVNKIAHLDTLWLLGEERWKVFCAADDIRKERIEWTKLEFRILQFRVRERELEDCIEDLQDQLENILEERSAVEQLHQDQMDDLSDQYNSSLSAVNTRLVSLSAKLKTTRIERDSLATQLSIFRSSNSSLQVSLDDSKKETEFLQRNVERLRLELEGKNRDAKEMHEQVKGWRRLEGKGNEEIETERAKRVELEVGLKVEKDRVKEGKKRVRELLAEFDATQTGLKEAQVEIESLRGEIEKAKKGSIRAKKALVQAQADADEQQKAATKRKRLAEDVLDVPVTKKVKKRQSLLPPNLDDERDVPSGHEHEPSPPPTPKLKKSRAKKPVTPTTYDVSLRPVKNGELANSQPQLANRPPEDDEREEPDVQVTLPKPAAKKKPPASRKEKAIQSKERASTTTAPSQEKKPKTPAEQADAVAPAKPKKKVNLGGGRGLLGGFGGLGGIGASNINWGGEMGGPSVYGIPLTLSSPVKGAGGEPVKAPQGGMFTFGANR